jgi:hypothetical protein
MNKLKEIMSYTNPELIIVLPVLIYVLWHVGYNLALEIWCVAYSMIY